MTVVTSIVIETRDLTSI